MVRIPKDRLTEAIGLLVELERRAKSGSTEVLEDELAEIRQALTCHDDLLYEETFQKILAP